MYTPSRILTTVGLILEFLALFIPLWEVFLSRKSRYYRHLEKKGTTVGTMLEEFRRETIILLTLIGLGLLF